MAKEHEERMLLELYRPLEPHQKAELQQQLWAYVAANEKIRMLAGGKIRSAKDSRIEEQFGHAPKLGAKLRPKKMGRGGSGKPVTRLPDRAQDDTEGPP